MVVTDTTLLYYKHILTLSLLHKQNNPDLLYNYINNKFTIYLSKLLKLNCITIYTCYHYKIDTNITCSILNSETKSSASKRKGSLKERDMNKEMKEKEKEKEGSVINSGYSKDKYQCIVYVLLVSILILKDLNVPLLEVIYNYINDIKEVEEIELLDINDLRLIKLDNYFKLYFTSNEVSFAILIDKLLNEFKFLSYEFRENIYNGKLPLHEIYSKFHHDQSSNFEVNSSMKLNHIQIEFKKLKLIDHVKIDLKNLDLSKFATDSFYTLNHVTETLSIFLQIYNENNISAVDIIGNDFIKLGYSERKPVIHKLIEIFENIGENENRISFSEESIRIAWTNTLPLIDSSNSYKVRTYFNDLDISELINAMNTIFRTDLAGLVISQWCLSDDFQTAIDHWFPAKGGKATSSNCVILHSRVNSKKSDILPQLVDFNSIRDELFENSFNLNFHPDQFSHYAFNEPYYNKDEDLLFKSFPLTNDIKAVSKVIKSISKKKPFAVYNLDRLLVALHSSSLLSVLGYPPYLSQFNKSNAPAGRSSLSLPENIIKSVKIIDYYFNMMRVEYFKNLQKETCAVLNKTNLFSNQSDDNSFFAKLFSCIK